MFQRDDGLTIPTPPGADVMALTKHDGHCVGLATSWLDGKYRELPKGSCLAATVACWDGLYVSFWPPNLLKTEWHITESSS
jgi:hypothetical protein